MKHKLVTCPLCKQMVRENWYVRHTRSGCKVGRQKEKVMSILSVDVETVPDEVKTDQFNKLVDIPKDLFIEISEIRDDGRYEIARESILNDWRQKQMSLTPEYCRIVGFNLMVEGLEPTSHWVGETVKSALVPDKTRTLTETDLLKKFWKLASENSTLVGYNILDFDLQVIKVRSMVLGVAPTVNLTSLKPWEDKVIDLMKRYFGGRKAMGLKKLRELLWSQLVAACPEMQKYNDLRAMEGGEVADLYAAKSLTALKRYGEFDAMTNMALYRIGKGFWW